MKRWMALILAAAMVFADVCVPITVAADMETEPTVVATTVATEETAAAVEETTVAAEETTVATEEIMDVAEDNVQSVEPAPVPAALSGTCGYSTEFGDIIWSLDNGTLTISGVGQLTDTPWVSYKEQITKVVIPAGITSTSNWWPSFSGYPVLTEVSIGMSEIKSQMFYRCENLTTVHLLPGVVSIGGSAFRDCDKLTTITLPETLVSIGDTAFGENEVLTEIVIPDSVTTIGDYALYQCPNLAHVTLPSSLSQIPKDLLANCDKLTEVNIPEGVTAIGNRAFCYCRELAEINLPDGLKSIGNYAFAGLPIENVIFPETLETIGESAFEGCDYLTAIHIPANVHSIGQRVFSPSHYANMQIITVSEDNKYFSIDSYGALLNKDKTVLHRVPSALHGVYVAPSTVQTIDPWACNRCLYLTEIQLPDTITEIGEYAFSNCCRLNKINIPQSLTVIESGSFNSCPLTELTFPEKLEEIKRDAFSWSRYIDDPDGTSYLKELVIPASVKKIGASAFANLHHLEKVTFLGDAPETNLVYSWDRGPFEQNPYKKCYYNWDNETFTDAAKEALGGEYCTWIPMGLEPAVMVTIPDPEVCADPLICGTVVLSNDAKNMAILMKIKPYETIRDLSLKFTLPDGFSFEKDSIVTEHVKQIGTLTQETTEPLPSIYPIYIGEENQMEDGKYCLTVEIIGTDSSGTKSRTDELVFYRPVYTTNVAESLTSFEAEDYEFSLDSAAGNGSIYNQETARLCAMMCDMAYDRDNMERFLTEEMGFSNFERQGVFVDNDPKMGVSGRYYASKRFIQDGEIKNIVYVVCRGTPLSPREWISNFTTGWKDTHHGFQTAASSIKEELTKYCAANGFAAKDTYIVVTGHSRGAAAANLVGHWLNELDDEKALAHKENVSVYTFATPNVSQSVITEAAGRAGNENIFNLVNYQDAIRNAPSMKYYGRYGNTTIFAYEIASEGATEYNDGYLTFVLPDNGRNYTVNEMVNSVLYDCDTGSVLSVGKALFALANVTKKRFSVFDFGDDASRLLDAHAMSVYYQAVLKNASDASFETVNQRTEEVNQYIWEWLHEVWDNASDWVDGAGAAAKDFIKYSYKCPINLYVYDSNGSLVASIVDKQVTCDDEELLIYVNGETLNVGLFEDEWDNYTIKIEGYDDGSMKHCIERIDVDGYKSVQVRENIPITNGGVLEVNDSGYVGLAGESEAEILAAYEIYEEEDEMEWVLENLEPRELTVDDAIYLVWHTLFPEMYPVVERVVDYNGDGEVTDADAVVLLWHILFPDEYSLT